ncbi:hypothetical protein ACIQ6V_29300 [Streptomyces sp. NPDC096198]|uniref:hypothetical protein n=1 Tax=Streptomyces sp. NPDC096198 TaxID=3366080 RepID=UPI003808895B
MWEESFRSALATMSEEVARRNPSSTPGFPSRSVVESFTGIVVFRVVRAAHAEWLEPDLVFETRWQHF